MQAIKDEIARAKYERKRFLGLATEQRKRATQLRRQRDWLGVINAQERVREYTNIAAQHANYAAEMSARLVSA